MTNEDTPGELAAPLVRVAWVGNTSATSLTTEVAHTCSEDGCQQPAHWLHWRYRNADSEQGEHSMIEGWLYCDEHGRQHTGGAA